MGGACSRKRGDVINEEGLQRGFSARYGKSGSSKWLGTSFSRLAVDVQQGKRKYPSLLELCIHKIREDIDKYVDKYGTFDMLPRDISQQIFNELVFSHSLTEVILEAFRDCALEDISLGDYPGVQDSWMGIICSQGSSLLSVDLSGSDVTDSGLNILKSCTNLQELTFNYCDRISDHGLRHICGLSNLTSLSFKRSNTITAQGMSAFTGLVNLVKLDLERCSGIHGGLVHLKGLRKLESLNIRCCNCITDEDMQPVSGLTNLKELQLSCNKITDFGVDYLKGLRKLILLNIEGCLVTGACLGSISALLALSYLNLNRCALSDTGCEKFSGLQNLKVLNLGFNNITNACLVSLKGGLTKLESLNLDSCRIGDEGLVNLAGLLHLKNLELSDTEVGSNGLRHISGLASLESLNLSFTLVSDSGLRKLSGLTSLKSLNLDARQITDTGLTALTGITGLTHLDLFGARITDFGTNWLRYFKNLRSLEICGGGITDAGVKNIKDLVTLTLLNLSQNANLTDKALEMISGMFTLSLHSVVYSTPPLNRVAGHVILSYLHDTHTNFGSYGRDMLVCRLRFCEPNWAIPNHFIILDGLRNSYSRKEVHIQSPFVVLVPTCFNTKTRTRTVKCYNKFLFWLPWFDCLGLLEHFKFTYNQRGIATSKAIEEFKITVLGVLQGFGKRNKEAPVN
ncbi:Leucine-rich repeat [Macleaya cordata]|uniref:Leucine-rich repeat n=1 Tax=Macleaya cordata TaxID=56857 RepID=A0A200R908_MACCD|nr:Leucine-rich repeat [Macleaya cordata]